MHKTDFLNIMQLTDADVRVVDPDVVGIALVVIHRNPRGELELQIGSNISEDLILETLMREAVAREKRKTRHG
jgi:hypothetical protein